MHEDQIWVRVNARVITQVISAVKTTSPIPNLSEQLFIWNYLRTEWGSYPLLILAKLSRKKEKTVKWPKNAKSDFLSSFAVCQLWAQFAYLLFLYAQHWRLACNIRLSFAVSWNVFHFTPLPQITNKIFHCNFLHIFLSVQYFAEVSSSQITATSY